MLTTIPVPYSIGINKPKKGTSYFSPIRVDDVGGGGGPDNNNNGFSGSGSAAASPGNSHNHNGNGNGNNNNNNGGSGPGNGEGGRLVGEYEQHPLRQQTSYLPISAVGGAQFVLKPPRVPKPKVVKGIGGGGGQQPQKGDRGSTFQPIRPLPLSPLGAVNGGGEPASTSASAPISVPVSAPGNEPVSIDESGPSAPSNREMTVERRLDEMVLVKEEDELDELRVLNGAGASQTVETRSGSEIVANRDVDGDGDVVMSGGGASADKDKPREGPVQRESTIISLLSSPPPPGPTASTSKGPTDNTFAAPARPSLKVKKHKCDICGQVFTRGGDVKRHKETKHCGVGRNNNKAGGGGKGGKGEKGPRRIGSGCRCPYCNRVLARWVRWFIV